MGQDRVGLRRALSLGTEWPWISLTIPAQFSPIPSFGLAVNPRRGGQWQRLSKISHPWFRDCPSTVTSWDIQANRSLCHTHTEPALKFPAHICPRSREATPAHPKHSLCANTRLGVGGATGASLLSLLSQHRQRSQPTPGLPPKETHRAVGAEEAAAKLPPVFLLDQ